MTLVIQIGTQYPPQIKAHHIHTEQVLVTDKYTHITKSKSYFGHLNEKDFINQIDFITGVSTYFDPGVDVQASGDQLLNTALTVAILLFAASIIIPVGKYLENAYIIVINLCLFK